LHFACFIGNKFDLICNWTGCFG